MRILVIEDEEKIGHLIQRGLSQHKWVVDLVKDGEEASFMAEVNPYDAMILDVMLPKKDGLSLCQDLRKKGINAPILMLTAKSSVKDRISGLNAGADDYLCKPFAFSELVARLRALMRRQRDKKVDHLQVGDLEMNLVTHQVMRAGELIDLTTKEFMMLEFFMLHAGEVVTRTMISEHVWHENFDSLTNVIDVHVKYLRDKIDRGFKNKLIHTVRGSGYTLKNNHAKPVSKKQRAV